jgi:hypothetical protein
MEQIEYRILFCRCEISRQGVLALCRILSNPGRPAVVGPGNNPAAVCRVRALNGIGEIYREKKHADESYYGKSAEQQQKNR